MGLPMDRRDDRFRKRSSDYFLSLPTEDQFRLRVPVLDDVCSIDGNESVVSGVDDRARPRLVLAERMFYLLAFRDVLSGAQKPRRLTGLIAHNLAFTVGYADCAVGPDDPVVESERIPRAERVSDVLLDLLAVVRVDPL